MIKQMNSESNPSQDCSHGIFAENKFLMEIQNVSNTLKYFCYGFLKLYFGSPNLRNSKKLTFENCIAASLKWTKVK